MSKKQRIMKTMIVLVLMALLSPALNAQELNCNVTVNSDKIEGSSKETFEALRQSVSEFINNNKWTNLAFTPIEKIDCNLLIIVNAVSENEFACEATIQASRPVYNTTYTTTLLNMRDKVFNFTYQAYDQLLYQQNTFQSNLTAMLAYYVYLILGIDADSYQRLGGSPYFQVCEDIVSSAQTASGLTEAEAAGWQYGRSAGGFSKSGSGRYLIANELMDEAFKPYRNYFYEYHRLCLDEMHTNVANSRARIAQGLTVLREVNKARSTNILVPMFLDAKVDELVNIFQGGTATEKTETYDLLMALDPTRSNTYEAITRQP